MLTKKDLSKIKNVVHDEVENLARIVARGFEAVDKRFEQIDKRFEAVDKRFEAVDKRFEAADKRFELIAASLMNINARLDVIEGDVSYIRRNFVSRDEFEDALARISLLERKVGIKSGK